MRPAAEIDDINQEIQQCAANANDERSDEHAESLTVILVEGADVVVSFLLGHGVFL